MESTLITLKVMDIVVGTATNNDGLPLFLALDKHLSKGQKVRLSMMEATPFSTSFMNASIGDIIDKYGFETFRHSVAFVQCRPAQAKYLKMYIDQITNSMASAY